MVRCRMLKWLDSGSCARQQRLSVCATQLSSTWAPRLSNPKSLVRYLPVLIYWSGQKKKNCPREPPRAKIGDKISPFLESYITTMRHRRLPVRALGWTKAETSHMNELGRLPLLAVATGPPQCAKMGKYGNIFLRRDHQRLCPSQIHCNRREVPLCLVQWLERQMN